MVYEPVSAVVSDMVFSSNRLVEYSTTLAAVR
jgi:hypothetical protein